jgi:hypothetical protein
MLVVPVSFGTYFIFILGVAVVLGLLFLGSLPEMWRVARAQRARERKWAEEQRLRDEQAAADSFRRYQDGRLARERFLQEPAQRVASFIAKRRHEKLSPRLLQDERARQQPASQP